jgi:hypothetical protein
MGESQKLERVEHGHQTGGVRNEQVHMARFSASKARAPISKYNSAVKRYNSAVRSHNARVRSAVNAYNREVRRYNEMLRQLRAEQRRVVVFYHLEWTTLTTVERSDLESEAHARGIEIQIRADDEESD